MKNRILKCCKLIAYIVFFSSFLLGCGNSEFEVQDQINEVTEQLELDENPEPFFAGAASTNFCSREKIRELINNKTGTITIDCNLTLTRPHLIRKTIVISGKNAKNLKINFGGSQIGDKNTPRTIRIQTSKNRSGGWHVPENIEIKNVDLEGVIRIGVGSWQTNHPYYGKTYALSRQKTYVSKLEAISPRNITIQNFDIHSTGTAIFIHKGSYKISILDSIFSGTMRNSTIYFGAETRNIIVKGNTFNTTNGREVLAVDASKTNRIIKNKFKKFDRGAIFLYRNCGESGVVRHTPPERNHIVDNIFFGSSRGPMIFIGSRQGNRGYCHRDNDSNLGSGKSDRDFARYNVVFRNQFINPGSSRTIIDNDTNNQVFGNQKLTSMIKRPAACYMKNTLPQPVHYSGQTAKLTTSGEQISCLSRKWTCNDGLWVNFAKGCQTPTYKVYKFTCAKADSNLGCSKKVALRCPGSLEPKAIRGTCNLENASLPGSEIASTAWGSMKITKSTPNQGTCRIGSRSKSIVGSSSFLNNQLASQNLEKFNLSCKEHDKNGGDCMAHLQLLCY